MKATIVLNLLVIAVLLCLSVVYGQDCDKEWTGCKVEDKLCVCGTSIACDDPYMYKSIEDCHLDLHGDVCKSNPCMNGGMCLQKKHKDFTCQCSGTGYYGKHCDKECKSKNGEDDIACVF
ncbi:protocadherin-like wing polarity protein stan [Glandiceps talaboti]